MAIPEATRIRIETQLDVIDILVARSTRALTDVPPGDGGWSARENVAHLARHAYLFLPRLQRILDEDRPNLGTYHPDADPEWPAWRALPLDEALHRVRAARARLVAWMMGLSETQTRRVGLHPTFGAMDAAGWLEFFLLHEAHHLYFLMRRLAQARTRAGTA
jgi:uncharacterized damage-inducible protein DinB